MRMERGLPKIIVLAGVALLLLSCSPQQGVQSLPSGNKDLERGAALYVGTCAQYCHGAGPQLELGSDRLALTASDSTMAPSFSRAADAPNLFDCTWQEANSNSEIEKTLISGIQGTRMVGFGENFPEGKRDHARLIAYLRVAAACEVEEPAID